MDRHLVSQENEICFVGGSFVGDIFIPVSSTFDSI